SPGSYERANQGTRGAVQPGGGAMAALPATPDRKRRHFCVWRAAGRGGRARGRAPAFMARRWGSSPRRGYSDRQLRAAFHDGDDVADGPGVRQRAASELVQAGPERGFPWQRAYGDGGAACAVASGNSRRDPGVAGVHALDRIWPSDPKLYALNDCEPGVPGGKCRFRSVLAAVEPL